MVLNMHSIFPNPSDTFNDEILSGQIKARSNYYYVGGDYVQGIYSNGTGPVELLDYIIPANTVMNGIKITVVSKTRADQTGADGDDEGNNGTIFINAGTDGAEVQRAKLAVKSIRHSTTFVGVTYCIITDLNWKLPQSISVTGTNDEIDTNSYISGEILLVEGF